MNVISKFSHIDSYHWLNAFLRYRLELGISDDTEQTVVVLFDNAAVDLVKFPASALVADEDEVHI